MKKIETKIETLGGFQSIENDEPKDNEFQVAQYLSDNKLNLPNIYIDFSEKYGGCMFNNDVVFSSISKIPSAYEDGSCPISIFYGWNQGEESLQENREAFIEQISEKYFVIAEANPGDQLLVNNEDNKIYYWAHEESENDCIFLVANSFEDFIESLEINKNKFKEKKVISSWFSEDFLKGKK